MERFLSALAWLFVLVAGCHIASGLDELEVITGDGSGGAAPAPITSVEDLCSGLCDIDTDRGCNLATCNLDFCRVLWWHDAFPWCEDQIFAYGDCLQLEGSSAFECIDDYLSPKQTVCVGELDDLQTCLAYGTSDSVVNDCGVACTGPLTREGPQCPTVMECATNCLALARGEADCGGAWSGVAHCAAKYPMASWTCSDVSPFPFPTSAETNPCAWPFGLAFECSFPEG